MTGALARAVRPFACVVSPYHLTTREPAALVSLQLAERAVTLLLAPSARGAGFDQVRREAVASPVYRAYMESWAWAMPLFDEGLIGTVEGGEDPVEAVRRAHATLAEDDACRALRRFLRSELFLDDRAYLRAASADVLKAGPDPGVSIPIAAGLDAFAAEHGLVVARSAAKSLAQKAEARLGRVLFRASVPVVVQGSAERVLLVRALLADQREALARAMTLGFETGDGGAVREAAARYAARFDAERAHVCAPPGPRDDDEVRVIVGEASLVGMDMPGDAVIRSSEAAAGGRPTPDPDASAVRTLVIRSMGGR